MKLSFTSFKNRIKSLVLNLTRSMEITHQLDYAKKTIHMCDNVRISSVAKEPDTVAWIENYFKPSDIVFDIGANVGAYSLVMAHYAKHVYAFEPAITNYRLLSKNILTNYKKNTIPPQSITPVNMAVSDKTDLVLLNYVNEVEGKSGHQIKDRTIDGFGDTFKPSVRHFIPAVSVDEFVTTYNVEGPNHIKIDVDGIEFEILKGAKKVLTGSNLKSIWVEVTEGSREEGEILKYLSGCGLHINDKFLTSEPKYKMFNYLFVKN